MIVHSTGNEEQETQRTSPNQENRRTANQDNNRINNQEIKTRKNPERGENIEKEDGKDREIEVRLSQESETKQDLDTEANKGMENEARPQEGAEGGQEGSIMNEGNDKRQGLKTDPSHDKVTETKHYEDEMLGVDVPGNNIHLPVQKAEEVKDNVFLYNIIISLMSKFLRNIILNFVFKSFRP